MNPPLDTLPLFPVLNYELESFLKSLSRTDWTKQTVASKWVIKDVAAHLLDGNLRKIARHRDHWIIPPGRPINGYDDLVDYLNELNQTWVNAAKRLSPEIITEILVKTNEEVLAIFKSLDPFGKAAHSVAWAGETESYNWFDTARQYTEFFIHQQQMRDAVNNQALLNAQLYYPFLDIFMRALPYTFRNVIADEGTLVKVVINGEGGGHWLLKFESDVRTGGKWKIANGETIKPASETIIDGNVAWKLFSKSVRKEDIKGSFEVKGDQTLGEKVLEMVSVMA